MRRLPGWWLLPLVLLSVGAAPELTPEELVRQGNAAFERDDYAAALDAFTRAEERSTNPGLVAHNKAAVLYRLGRYDEAARHFEGCLEEAAGTRRAALLYDLGNCRMHQSGGTSTERLQHAIDCFSQCLRQNGIEPALRDDARYNLEVAKLMWARAKQAAANPDGNNQQDPPPEPSKPPDTKQPPETKNGGDPDPNLKVDPRSGIIGELDPKSAQQTPIPTREPPPPGKGNLPPIPDTAEPVDMSPEDAAEHVRRATERILRERRLHQQQSAPAPRGDLPDY
jgi:tetratricopeptide (TPR) repeat protein